MNRKHVTLLVILLLLLDQAVKIVVKTHMTLDQSIPVFGNWFFIRFIENPGAAFGMQLGGSYGKLALSLFRIVAVGALCWFLDYLVRKRSNAGLIAGFSLILAGALGNIIDSAFYGLVFSESTPWAVAQFLPAGGGYAGFLHGKVVDMLYFPLFSFDWPAWMPMVGGDRFVFFQPVFNLADSAITVGVLCLIFFYSKEIASPSQLRKAGAEKSLAQ